MSQKINTGTGSKGDVSYIRATPTGSLPPMSPPLGRDKNHAPQMIAMDFEVNQREELLMKEVEEARIRASQMEKTMRWWSDCTSNWREKWNKARNERNKAREENRQLRAKIESVVKECSAVKREKHELALENEQLKKRLGIYDEKDKVSEASGDSVKSGMTNEDNFDSFAKDGSVKSGTTDEDNCQVKDADGGGVGGVDDGEKDKDEADVDDLTVSVHDEENAKDNRMEREHKRKVGKNVQSQNSMAEEKVVLLQMKLDEAQKTVVAERQEKCGLVKSMDKLQAELTAMKSKYEELRQSRQEAAAELSKLRDDHKDEIGRLTQEMEEDTNNRSSMDRRVGELRRELERLQTENASEWGKRERLETEKLALERDNKKMRNQIEDLEEQLERKHQQTSAMVDCDLRTLQFELSEKNKELNDLRHTHAKTKKALHDRLTELDHTKRRAEQYELEVKKLRGRVEELKKDLATAEDEVDTEGNMVRKLQRSNDELQEQVENLQVQVEHLQSRLRRSSQPLSTVRASSLKSFTLDDSGEAADSDDDLDDDT
ncbi:coiled-coil domain-containing protein 102A-like isoform X2 [Gigantopelta aegis]|uniref:coiled-coil domain-containing protein 102A-like isoform X2 n=1 Tax=Gigantopelta aegis TaxID=1735272 RepID=UPI001B88B1A0|nr:coiled-coil domain-containing protein 102A-like isoform X2 [Gigantopelta aegis]